MCLPSILLCPSFLEGLSLVDSPEKLEEFLSDNLSLGYWYWQVRTGPSNHLPVCCTGQ